MSSKLPSSEDQDHASGLRIIRLDQGSSHQKPLLNLPIPSLNLNSPSPTRPGSSNAGKGIKESTLNFNATAASMINANGNGKTIFASTPFHSPQHDEDETFRRSTLRPCASVAAVPSINYAMISSSNRGEALLKSLNILVRIQKRDQEKLRLLTLKSKGPTLKKQEKEKSEGMAFEFTADMFNFSNPAAFFHVTHFLFEILDQRETELVFKGCWPLFDKKQETEYRRNAYTWASKIVEDHKEFFPNCVLCFPLFVTPYGDKFLRFMGQFVTFAMYAVAQGRQKDGVEIMKPNYAASEAEKWEQVKQFQCTKMDLRQRAVKSLETTMSRIEKHNEQKAVKLKAQEENAQILMQEKEKLLEIVQRRPELFPDDAIGLIDSRSEKIKAEANDVDYDPTNYSISEDSLSTVVTKEWEQKLAEVNGMFNKVDKFCNKHARLCKIVESMESNGKVVLDGSKLLGLRKLGCAKPDLGEYFQNVNNTMEKLCADVEQIGKPSDQVVEKITAQLQRHKLLTRQSESMGNSRSSSQFEQVPMTREEEEELQQQVIFETKKLQLELNDTKWERLSKCASASSPEKLFTWTPIRSLDVAKGGQSLLRSKTANGNNTQMDITANRKLEVNAETETDNETITKLEPCQ